MTFKKKKTNFAGQRPTRVYERVLLHVRLLVEALAAVLAGVGPRVGMYEQVSGQRGRALEDFPAHAAAKFSAILTHRKHNI